MPFSLQIRGTPGNGMRRNQGCRRYVVGSIVGMEWAAQ
jgi:hypothetical protein